MDIREIAIKDIDAFMELAKQLGYEAEKQHLKECISNKDENEVVFVAEKSDRIIGWIDCKISHSFMNKPYGEIAGFIVDENERSKGVGECLLKQAELWMSGRCAERIVVHSNIKRERAHKFYQSNGYVLIKRQCCLEKK